MNGFFKERCDAHVEVVSEIDLVDGAFDVCVDFRCWGDRLRHWVFPNQNSSEWNGIEQNRGSDMRRSEQETKAEDGLLRTYTMGNTRGGRVL